MDDLNKFYEESLNFNWDMLEENPNYYVELNSVSTFQKIDELYDMMIYFMERNEFEKCEVINTNLSKLISIHRNELKQKGML